MSPLTLALKLVLYIHLNLRHGSSTRGPPVRIMRLAATFLNSVCAIKITQRFRRLRTPPTLIFLRVAGNRPTITGVALRY